MVANFTSLSESYLISLGKKAHNAINTEINKSKLCAYSLGLEDGTVVVSTNPFCHAFLQYFREKGLAAAPLVLANTVQTERPYYDKNLCSFYLEWLINESPYANAFLSKDVDKLVEDGILVDLRQPYNYVCGAAIATRYAWEYPENAKVFMLLAHEGVDKDKAFLASTSLVKNLDGTFSCFPADFHTCLSASRITKEVALNFLEGNLQCGKTSYSIARTYDHIDGVWVPKNSRLNPQKTFYALLQTRSILSGSEYIKKDPFGILEVKEREKKDQLESIKEFINDFFQ